MIASRGLASSDKYVDYLLIHCICRSDRHYNNFGTMLNSCHDHQISSVRDVYRRIERTDHLP